MPGIIDMISQMTGASNQQGQQNSVPGFMQQLLQQGSQQGGAGDFTSMVDSSPDTGEPPTGKHGFTPANPGLLTQAQGMVMSHFVNRALNNVLNQAGQNVNSTGGGMQGGMQSASSNMVPEGSGGSYGFSGLDGGGGGAGAGASSGGGKSGGGGAANAEDL
jgi:hypothetical protein